MSQNLHVSMSRMCSAEEIDGQTLSQKQPPASTDPTSPQALQHQPSAPPTPTPSLSSLTPTWANERFMRWRLRSAGCGGVGRATHESVSSCTSLASVRSADCCGDENGPLSPLSPPALPIGGSSGGHTGASIPPASGHEEEHEGIGSGVPRTQTGVSKHHSTLKESSGANRLLRKFRSINDFHVCFHNFRLA